MNATYTQGDGKWHSEYMAKVKTMPTDSLQYVIKDCRNAIEALPENPKCEQYMDEIHYCATCENPTHRHIAAARDQFDIAEQAYDVADYARCSDACHVGLSVLEVK